LGLDDGEAVEWGAVLDLRWGRCARLSVTRRESVGGEEGVEWLSDSMVEHGIPFHFEMNLDC
jgi:hypothetical protein